MARIIDRIWSWAKELKYWEQAALELLASGSAIAEADYQRLLDFCMHDAGLVQLPSSRRPAHSFSAQVAAEEATGYRLERMFNLQNVNALPCGQEIIFGGGLTLIYGDNGSGKTGYVRPLGSGAFARGERDVLPNATSGSNSNSVPQADIELSKDGVKTVITWIRGESRKELAGFYIFDTVSLQAHLAGPNALSFSPAGLSLLRRLAELTDEVRARLKNLLDLRDRPHNLGVLFPGESAVASEIQGLSVASDFKTFEQLALLTEVDLERVEELEIEITRLRSADITSRAAELRKGAADLRRFSSSLAECEVLCGAAGESVVGTLLSDLESATLDAERSGAERFRMDSFKQVGTEVWREFIVAAKSLAEAESSAATYSTEGQRCLLCRQPLSAEAASLLRNLWDFLASDATSRFEAAERTCATKRREVEQVGLPYFGEDSDLRRTLTSRAANLVPAVDSEIDSLRARRVCLLESLQRRALATLPGLAPVDRGQFATIAEAMESEATSLEADDVPKKLQQLHKELRQLQHRRTLSEQLPAVRSYIDLQRWILRGRQHLGSTHAITAKHNELFTELVTDRFVKLFQSILADLNRNVKVTIETHGKKGQTVRQIVLSPDVFATRFPIDEILSEGEKRAVALADFFTEATLDDACTALVLDDPVTSFDLGSRLAVARTLAKLALSRQIVVFTHDPVFLYQVRAEAKSLSVGTVTHWIRRGDDGKPGFVFLNNGPVCQGDYKSARIAREWHAKAKVAPPQEQQLCIEQGFNALRTSYEAFVVFDLFAGVVERWEERIKYDQLVQVYLEKDIVGEVVEKLALLSRYVSTSSQ